MTPAPEDKNPETTGEYTMGSFIADVLQTRECRDMIDTLASELLDKWSQEHSTKKVIARLYRLFIGKRLTQPAAADADKHLLRLFEKPEIMENAGKTAPDWINAVIDSLNTLAHTLEHLPDEKKNEIVGNFFSSIDTGKIAETLMSLFRTTGSLRSVNPKYVAEKIIPQVRKWLDHTDFGELRELFDKSKADYDTLIVQLCELAFEYPAKFIILLSFIPGIANYAILFLADMTRRFNSLSPDMLADILLSFFRELDGQTAGDLFNNLTEIIRQIHTGSALVGESGAPRFTMDFSGKTRQILEKTDPVLFIKARNAMIDGKETIFKIFMDVAAENPEFLVQQLNHLAVRRNSKSRLLKRKIEHIENMPEDISIKALATGLAEWNTYDLADTINSLSRMANSIHNSHPEVMASIIREFTGALDLYEIEETVRWLAADIGHAFRPLARVVFPTIVKAFSGFLTPEDDGQDPAIQEAREILRGFILNEEERS